MGRRRGRRGGRLDKAIAPGLASSLGRMQGSVTELGDRINSMREYLNAAAVPRLPVPSSWNLAPFGPGMPLAPAPINAPRSESGRPEPRRYEYPISWNLTGTADRLTSWALLRSAADGVSLFRRCIEIRKDHMGGLDWDVVISQGAIEAAQRDDPGSGRASLEDKMRKRLMPEIDRAVTFISEPDRGNGEDFSVWLSKLLEEIFVLDALAIYPRRTFGGDLFSLEILDGSTIKPLLDERGGRPLAPMPAYQQILYGFPRGEYTADVTLDDAGREIIDGAYQSDELIYTRRVARVWTPYGYSAVEQALDDGDLYNKRHLWMKTEYTDGTTVEGLFKTPEGLQWTPAQLLEYEREFNDAMSGNDKARRRARFLPPGFEPVDNGSIGSDAIAEKYKPEYDLHLIKLLASHFDTTLPELGFTEAKGLGSDGYHEGQENVQQRKTRPIIKFVQQLITGILRRHAGMPKELEFKFLGLDEEDDPGADDVETNRLKNGLSTLNERRDALGLPRYTFPEADMPMIITGQGVVLIEGTMAAAAAGAEIMADKGPKNSAPGGEAADLPPEQDAGGAEGGQKPPGAPKGDGPGAAGAGASTASVKAAELTAYKRWMKKVGPDGGKAAGRRPFVFEHWTADELAKLHVADEIQLANVQTKAGDADPKAPAPVGRQWPGWTMDLRVVELAAPRLLRALTGAGGSGSWRKVAQRWKADRNGKDDLQITPAAVADARHWLDEHAPDLAAAMRPVLRDVWTQGYFIGERSASAMAAALLLVRKPVVKAQVADDPGEWDVEVDWGAWEPGDAVAAARILGEEGLGDGLAGLLDRAGVQINSIAGHRLDQLARVLAQSLTEGWSSARLGRELRGVLDDPRWARMVATTETARAVSVASLDRYYANGIEAKEWMTAKDERTCPYCNEDEGDGPIPLGAYFSSGDDAPPGHPDCRCAIAPAWLSV